jgi:bifunctional isochorismate lyase/aryl carrier protein
MPIPTIAPYGMPTPADLPATVAGWSPDPTRTALLIHDMQEYFVDFFTPGEPPVTDLVANIARIHRVAAELGIPVVYTAQPGGMTPADRGLLLDFWGPGMAAREEHRQIIDRLAPGAGDVVITKWRYSAFHRSRLADLLAEHGRDQLVICGIYAHVGCLATACDAFSADIQPFLVADAVADFDRASHDLAVSYATQRCAVTLCTGDLIDALRTGARRDEHLAGRQA